MVTRYTGGNMHNLKTALKVLLVGILLGTAAAVSTPFANKEGVVTRLNEEQEYVSILLPDHTYGIVQNPVHLAPAAEFDQTQGAREGNNAHVLDDAKDNLPHKLHVPQNLFGGAYHKTGSLFWSKLWSDLCREANYPFQFTNHWERLENKRTAAGVVMIRDSALFG